MKKVSLILILMLSVLNVFAAGGSRPDWITRTPEDKEFIYAVGHAKTDIEQYSYSMAVIEGCETLTKEASRAMKKYAPDVDTYSIYISYFVYSTESERREKLKEYDPSEAALGIIVEEKWVSPDGTYYVLLKSSRDSIDEVARKLAAENSQAEKKTQPQPQKQAPSPQPAAPVQTENSQKAEEAMDRMKSAVSRYFGESGKR